MQRKRVLRRLVEAAQRRRGVSRPRSVAAQLTASKVVFASDQSEIVFSSVNQRKVINERYAKEHEGKTLEETRPWDYNEEL